MPQTLIYPFDTVIPAGTLKTAPLIRLCQFEANIVDRIEWEFPEGCQGQVGIAIGAGAVPVIPPKPNLYFTSSGSTRGFDVSDMHTTGDWSVIGYNVGSFNHSIRVTFRVHRITRETVPRIYIFDGSDLGTLGES